MDHSHIPDYAELTDVLDQAGIATSAAEAHGIITAALCAPKMSDWQRLLLGKRQATGELGPCLAALYEETGQRLTGVEFLFAPLLPAGPLPAQVDALGDWCRGFLLGLSASGVDIGDMRGDAGEFISDASRIAEAQMSDDGSEEEQERELAEIVEYLRVGVQLVYEELHGANATRH